MNDPGKVDLSTFDNSWYRPGSFFVRALWFVVGRIFINTYFPHPVWLKRFVLRLFGAKLGREVIIKPKVNIKYPWFLTVGNQSWIGEGVWMDNLGKVAIGDNCVLSQGCMLLCGNHDYKKTSFDLIVGDITLEEGAWIGAKAIVCPGVTAKSHAVLAAGSVATGDLAAYGIYQGNPALRVGERDLTPGP
jgi:putative colanic acid biosynthesis acetyltransferase WcaF